MFKSILPSKRGASFDLVSPAASNADQGKENRPQHPLATMVSANEPIKVQKGHMKKQSGSVPAATAKATPKEGGRLMEAGAMNRAFEKMLDDMQIPATLRPKLTTLDSPVKAAMLKSSQTMSLLNPAFPNPVLLTATPPLPSLRRSRSIESLPSSPGRGFGHASSPSLDAGPNTAELFAPPRPLSGDYASGSSLGSSSSLDGGISRNGSMEFLPSLQFPNAANGQPEQSSKGKNTKAKANKEKQPGQKEKPTEKELSAEFMSNWLTSTKSGILDVDRLKRLRLLLRNEAASWSEVFLRQGGYAALLARLTDLLEMEWREEQHDDQALHEILRCFKALSTSSIGCFALRSACPAPFAQLVRLLYSDKKPGDVATRQLIVDLLLILYELYTPAKKDDYGLQRNAWEVKNSGHVIPPARPTVFSQPNSPPPPLPEPHTSIFSLLRAILLTPRPAPSDSPSIPVDPHAFIAELHRPRIYKTYLQELADIRRDYFWVFCHPTNTVWDLKQTDEASVEKPQAPGGMTGGVEYEAMTYLTTHFRLLNTLCRAAADLDLPPSDPQSAWKLHSDLFESGLEKILLTARKASTTYYPQVHLEIGRYVMLTTQANFELPWSVSRYIGQPPAHLVKRRPIPVPAARPISNLARPSSPIPGLAAGGRPPSLPPPRRMEQIKF